MWSDKLYKADINFSGSGDNTVVTGQSGKRIAIDFLAARAENGQTVLQMKDGSTAYGGPHTLFTHEAMVFDNVMRNHDGIITLSAGQNFVINNGSAVQVSGFVRYRLLDNS